jgi:hypothetical protein
MSTSPYSHKLNQHQALYKESWLAVTEPGMWVLKGKPLSYRYIVAREQHALNLLRGIRRSCLAYLESYSPPIKLHKYFHHLNSSQAMCFNLFFPFVDGDLGRMASLLQVLGLPRQEWKGCFEKVLVEEEGTSFDFQLENENGVRVFFELKLSETGFGTADGRRYAEKYATKLEKHYRVPLQDIVRPKWLKLETLCRHYEILRNISYLGRHPSSRLYFIYPEANTALESDVAAIKEICSYRLVDRVTLLPLEDLVERILDLGVPDAALQSHFTEFKQKYIP